MRFYDILSLPAGPAGEVAFQGTVRVGGDGLRTALQHHPGRSAGTQIADHPDAGAGRRLDAQHRGPRVLGGSGDEADDAARVLVVVVARHRDPPCGVIRTEESLHAATLDARDSLAG